MTAEQGRTLWRNKNFVFLWIGQSASEIGAAITVLALPLLAINTLDASTAQIGILQACSALSFLVASVPAGILIDRSSKRTTMLVCDAGRALLLASIPLMLVMDQLAMLNLYVIAFLAGVLTVVFGIAYHSYYPSFVPRENLAEANAKIGATEAFARVSGPGIGAGLVGAFSAAAAIIADVVSYVISIFSLLLCRTPADKKQPAAEKIDWRREAAEGFSLVRQNQALLRTGLCTMVSMFSLAMSNAVFIYYLVKDLGVSSAAVGIIFGIGEIGGLVAAVLATRIMRQVGTARIMWLVVFAGPVGFLLAMATEPTAMVLAAIFVTLSSARYVLFDIAQYSYRQIAVPLHKLGKVNATIRLGIGTLHAVGALIGGWLGVAIGARQTIVVATVVLCAAGLLVIFSPVRGAREVEDLLPRPVDRQLTGPDTTAV